MIPYLPEIEYFFASLTFYALGYVFVDFIFKKNIAYDLLFQDRKYYFQKNLVKTFALVAISLYGSHVLYNGVYHNNWDNRRIHQIGYIYSALDVMGLYFVKNLPLNSKIHHIGTFIFSYLNSYIDYSTNTFWIGLPVYCIFSSYAFGVNLFLALRLIKPLSSLQNCILYNLYSYGLLLAANWVYQIYNLFYKPGVKWTNDAYLFIFLMLFIANDDIKLMRFLHHQLQKVNNL
jgi:hypothetical protein